jgi:hypothetical protein
MLIGRSLLILTVWIWVQLGAGLMVALFKHYLIDGPKVNMCTIIQIEVGALCRKC